MSQSEAANSSRAGQSSADPSKSRTPNDLAAGGLVAGGQTAADWTASDTDNGVAAAIERARLGERAALIAYLPCGFPSLAASIDACRALIRGGVDAVELGLPYSDPVMDGPVIGEAVTAALAAGFRVDDLFEAVAELAPVGVPIEVMTYYNPVFRRGVDRFAADLADVGGAGLITPDLIPEEAGEWIAAADRFGLDKIFLVAPSSPPARLALTAAAGRGFTYATSTMGVTGLRESLSELARPLVERTRVAGADNVCVGVGVSTPQQASAVAEFADGVIVGSAFVKRLAAGRDLEGFAAELVEATRR
ncbi:MAG: tryptophan synthase subunit alpha [Bifidobacteriaceae bacterium]|jgi:tryptophan synthase alpha chain|nr:tryptophan synthase subunit alpha [Bifidobacteriaceae bacterium]